MNVSSDSSKESGHLGSSFDLESDYNPATQKVYSRQQSKKDRRGMFSLRRDPTPVESDFQKEAIISQVTWLNCFHSVCFLFRAIANSCTLLLVHFSVLSDVGGFSHHNQNSATSFQE